MSQEPLTPIFIEVADPATAEITVSDVLIGAFSFTGVLAVIAMVLAALFAWTLIGLRGNQRRNLSRGPTRLRRLFQVSYRSGLRSRECIAN
jgi:hypothetical protein